MNEHELEDKDVAVEEVRDVSSKEECDRETPEGMDDIMDLLTEKDVDNSDDVADADFEERFAKEIDKMTLEELYQLRDTIGNSGKVSNEEFAQMCSKDINNMSLEELYSLRETIENMEEGDNNDDSDDVQPPILVKVLKR